MRVLVCGGREYTDAVALGEVLDRLHAETPFAWVIHGASRGADALAEQWARAAGVSTHAFPADWDLHGRSAGVRRNNRMLVEGKPDLVVAFPGGRGTAHMKAIARASGVQLAIMSKRRGKTEVLFSHPRALDERGAELVEWVVWVGSLVGVASAVGAAVRDGLGAAVGAVLAGLAGP